MSTPTETRLNLTPEVRTQVAGLLNPILADLTDLISQCHHAHWNVRGRLFHPLHKLFEELAGLLEGHLDPLAERIVTLGGVAHGTVRQAAKGSRLADISPVPAEELSYVTELAALFATAGAAVRSGIDTTTGWGDAGTADLLTGLSQDLDKGTWLLEAHLRR